MLTSGHPERKSETVGQETTPSSTPDLPARRCHQSHFASGTAEVPEQLPGLHFQGTMDPLVAWPEPTRLLTVVSAVERVLLSASLKY